MLGHVFSQIEKGGTSTNLKNKNKNKKLKLKLKKNWTLCNWLSSSIPNRDEKNAVIETTWSLLNTSQ